MRELAHDTIALEYDIAASPERVFEALTREIGAWWSHRFKAEGVVSLEPVPGGAFRETWPGGGAVYATVTYLEPPRKLRLSGPMGMSGAVACTMEFELLAKGGGSRLLLVHDILGRLEPGTVDSYRAGWKQLLGEGLKARAEGSAR